MTILGQSDDRSLWKHEALRTQLWQSCALSGPGRLSIVAAKGWPLASMFSYRSEVRKLILDFKVKGSWQSGQALVEIFCNETAVQEWAKDSDRIMPVPSSFWGRCHGKHDLAYALAEGLSHELGIPLYRAPWGKYFRWGKQSFLSRSERVLEKVGNPHSLSRRFSFRDSLPSNLRGLKEPRILLIDDIVTSANTLTALAGAFRTIRFRFLTLASAYHRTNETFCSAKENL